MICNKDNDAIPIENVCLLLRIVIFCCFVSELYVSRVLDSSSLLSGGSDLDRRQKYEIFMILFFNINVRCRYKCKILSILVNVSSMKSYFKRLEFCSHTHTHTHVFFLLSASLADLIQILTFSIPFVLNYCIRLNVSRVIIQDVRPDRIQHEINLIYLK